jgi:hypothetical protein
MGTSNVVTVGPSLFKLLLAGLMITGGVAGVVLGLAIALLGLDWLLSSGPVILLVTGALAAGLILIAIIVRRPRVEIGPDGFIIRTLFGSRSRDWTAIEGRFAVIKVGLGKGVGYHLTQRFKESAGIRGTTLFAGNDEVIAGVLDLPMGELAELLNQHMRNAACES